MKQVIVFAIGMLMCGTSFAQAPAGKKELTPAQKKAADLRKNAVGGFIRDGRMRPLTGIRTFIYQTDSANTIIASGYSDASGYYETNSVQPGKYTIKIYYPVTNKTVTVSDVAMKRGITDISLKMDMPAADTSIPYVVFQPKPVEKVKVKVKQ